MSIAAVAALVLFGAACGFGGDAEEPTPVPPGRAVLTLVNGAGKSARLVAEIADEPAERTTGLSGRSELAADAGMLFVIPVRGAGFWMKDTLIPLSVAFIGPCGQIVAIADMEPLSLQTHNTEREYSFGLEVNQGWFQRNGIAVGDQVRIPDELKRPGCS